METWSPIPHCPGYEASDQGRIRSVDRTVTSPHRGTQRLRGRVIKAYPNPDSRRAQVRLSFGAEQRTFLVAALVLSAFVGPRPPGADACHNSGDPVDDRLENLRWDTRSENMLDVIRHGRHNHAGKAACKNGHPFDAANTYLTAKGKRSCRRCSTDAVRRYRARQAQAVAAAG